MFHWFDEGTSEGAKKAWESRKAGSAGGEQSHPTHPLPNSPGGHAIYDHPDGESSRVSKKPDGSYYGQHPEYDFSAPDAETMRGKLKSWGAKHVGWEHKDSAMNTVDSWFRDGVMLRDYGTSEGAKKAAQTRGSGGSRPASGSAAHEHLRGVRGTSPVPSGGIASRSGMRGQMGSSSQAAAKHRQSEYAARRRQLFGR